MDKPMFESDKDEIWSSLESVRNDTNNSVIDILQAKLQWLYLANITEVKIAWRK